MELEKGDDEDGDCVRGQTSSEHPGQISLQQKLFDNGDKLRNDWKLLLEHLDDLGSLETTEAVETDVHRDIGVQVTIFHKRHRGIDHFN